MVPVRQRRNVGGITSYRVPPTGDCMFICFVLHLYGWAASQEQLNANIDAVRTLVCDEVRSSREECGAFLTNCDDMFLQFSDIARFLDCRNETETHIWRQHFPWCIYDALRNRRYYLGVRRG